MGEARKEAEEDMRSKRGVLFLCEVTRYPVDIKALKLEITRAE